MVEANHSVQQMARQAQLHSSMSQAAICLARQAAIKETKRALAAKGLKPQYIARREIVTMAKDYLAAHPELIAEAKPIVEQRRREGFFGKEKAARTGHSGSICDQFCEVGRGFSMTTAPALRADRAFMRPVRRANAEYRVREHLTEAEVTKLLAALKGNRHGHRDWLIGLMIYRHRLRVSEACDLRWDDIDLTARTIVIRRLRGSRDSTHYLERDELWGLRRLPRSSGYVFVNERGDPFKREGIARMIQRAGKQAGIPFAVHVHMLRHACGYALASKGMDTRRLQHYLGHASITNTVRYSAMSPEPFRDIWR